MYLSEGNHNLSTLRVFYKPYKEKGIKCYMNDNISVGSLKWIMITQKMSFVVWGTQLFRWYVHYCGVLSYKNR